VKFDVEELPRKIGLNIPNLVKIGYKYRTIYMKIEVGFIVSGDITLYQAVRIAEEV
jgi:hypothetical protein